MGPGFESLKVHQRIRDTVKKTVQGIYRKEFRIDWKVKSRDRNLKRDENRP